MSPLFYAVGEVRPGSRLYPAAGVLYFVAYHLFRQVYNVLMKSIYYFVIVWIVFTHYKSRIVINRFKLVVSCHLLCCLDLPNMFLPLLTQMNHPAESSRTLLWRLVLYKNRFIHNCFYCLCNFGLQSYNFFLT